jgi:DNA repair exonuclease SbcCD nuclease subunit
MFRFLHAADLHLDRPLKGLTNLDPSMAEQVQIASRTALQRMFEVAIREDVQFVLLAGDIFDGDVRDYGTVYFLLNELGRLSKSIPVYVIRGNHDALNAATRRMNWPANVFEFPAGSATRHVISECKVAITGQSFGDTAEAQNLVQGYPSPLAGHFNIGLLHTSLAGAEGHDTYAPTSEQELSSLGYDYWALGHIHARRMVRSGSPWIVFPGNIQGSSVRECGPRGCVIVEVDDLSHATAQFVDLDAFRFHTVTVTIPDTSGRAEWIDRTVAEVSRLPLGEGNAVRVSYSGLHAFSDNESEQRDFREQLAQELASMGRAVCLESVHFTSKQSLSNFATSSEDLQRFAEILAEWERTPSELSAWLENDPETTKLASKLGKVMSSTDIRRQLRTTDSLADVITRLR